MIFFLAADLQRVAAEAGVEDALHRRLVAFAVTLADVVRALSTKLLLGSGALARMEDGGVADLLNRGERRDFAVVLADRGVEEEIGVEYAVVLDHVPRSALGLAEVARVEQRAVTLTGNVGRIVGVGAGDAILRGQLPRELSERLTALIGDRTEECVANKRGDVVFAVVDAVAAEEPGLVANDRATDRHSGVIRREIRRSGVFVVCDEGAVLCVVVH